MQDTIINLEEMGIINAQEQTKLYPDTFEAPSQSELESLTETDYAKICVSGERFWVLITKVEKNTIEGTVDNILICSDEHNLYYGDLVKFSKKHIYAHLKVD